jgi:hypothetical protein
MPVFLEESAFELLPRSALFLYLEHLRLDARYYHPRESGQPHVLRDVPHHHFGPVGLQVFRRVLPAETANRADDRFYGPVEGIGAFSRVDDTIYR